MHPPGSTSPDDSQHLRNPLTGQTPLQKKRWRALIIAYALLVMDICVICTLAGRFDDPGNLGGVDGCLVDLTGRPVMAVVTISGASRLTDADGCFFFYNLQPGFHNFTITLSNESELRQSVRITRKRATHIGDILVEP